jgi:ABC-type Na+ transport system ATPase subunit NatA
MTWSPQQEQALVAVRQWFIDPSSPQIFRLFGFAGTGKTTLSQEVANLIEDDGDGKVFTVPSRARPRSSCGRRAAGRPQPSIA